MHIHLQRPVTRRLANISFHYQRYLSTTLITMRRYILYTLHLFFVYIIINELLYTLFIAFFPSKVQPPRCAPHQRGPAIWPSSALLDIPQSGSPDARESNVWVFSQFGGAGSCFFFFFFLIFYPVFVLGGAIIWFVLGGAMSSVSRDDESYFPILNEEQFWEPQEFSTSQSSFFIQSGLQIWRSLGKL